MSDDGEEEKEDPLDYFKYFNGKFPLVEVVAKNLLCIPAASVPSESLFSHAGLIYTYLRNRLAPNTLKMMTFLKDNLFTSH